MDSSFQSFCSPLPPFSKTRPSNAVRVLAKGINHFAGSLKYWNGEEVKDTFINEVSIFFRVLHREDSEWIAQAASNQREFQALIFSRFPPPPSFPILLYKKVKHFQCLRKHIWLYKYKRPHTPIHIVLTCSKSTKYWL